MGTVSAVEENFGLVPELQTKTHTPRGTAVEVKIWKVGGGTVGKAYDSELWAVVIRSLKHGRVFFEAEDLKIPGPTKHKDVPSVALGWLE